jgi:hypothetical protein
MQIFHSPQQIESEDELTVTPFFVFIFRVSVPVKKPKQPNTYKTAKHKTREHTRAARTGATMTMQ